MDETKISQKTGLGVGPDKDFFGNPPTVPHKPSVFSKPTELGVSDIKKLPAINSGDEVAFETPTEQANQEAYEKVFKPKEVAKSFENSEGLPQLRTYKQDVAQVMRDKKTSLVQLVLEEQKGRMKREREQSPTSRKNLPLILLSLVFLVATVGLIYYIYFRTHLTDQTLESLHVTPIIFVEKNAEISADGKAAQALTAEIVKTIQNTNLNVDMVEYLFFTETLSSQFPNDGGNPKNLLPADRFFATLAIKLPPMFLRSLRPSFMFGFHSFNKNQPFLILKTDYYDNAFAGMLEWENNMSADLLPLFGRADRITELSQRKWDDMVIKNKDTRALRNFDGSIALLYAFKDQQTLIITTNEDTLLEISRRLDLAQEKRSQ